MLCNPSKILYFAGELELISIFYFLFFPVLFGITPQCLGALKGRPHPAPLP
jgi:hypothetical protein